MSASQICILRTNHSRTYIADNIVVERKALAQEDDEKTIAKEIL
ncbi:cullin-1 [Aspergillus luchuensis]|uniref:Cullin-1 n=1 Tax=Aspergillus kawachii TaxID=1069201 RepID=A0A146FH31_ASPKA|nr:cullin-1 [Aspergillus luchuensis]